MKIKATDRVWVASLVGWEGQLDGSKSTVSGNRFQLLTGSPLYPLGVSSIKWRYSQWLPCRISGTSRVTRFAQDLAHIKNSSLEAGTETCWGGGKAAAMGLSAHLRDSSPDGCKMAFVFGSVSDVCFQKTRVFSHFLSSGNSSGEFIYKFGTWEWNLI